MTLESFLFIYMQMFYAYESQCIVENGFGIALFFKTDIESQAK